MKTVILVFSIIFMSLLPVQAAYHHSGDTDSSLALQAYPAIADTKLDNCALCHTGGKYLNYKGKEVSLGSCQWCHYSFGYDESGDIGTILNGYGKAYKENGKSESVFSTIENLDSDGDSYSNSAEIAALRYPGNENDDPTKVAAPFKVYSLEQLEDMPSHSQIMLMNTHKSGDFYAEYTGVTMAKFLNRSKILESATGITAYAPDGWAQYHPLEEDADPLM